MKKIMMIVGAGKGLGNAIAREFASHNFRVVLVARSAEHLAEYKTEFEAEGIETYTKVADAAKPATLTAVIDEVKTEIGTPDVFVYHVGNITMDPENITNELIMEHYQVDVASAYVCADYLGKDEEFAEKKGAILFTGGGFAKTFATIPVLKVLCIDKAAMNAANIVLHDTLAPKGIFVGSVLVSGVITESDEKYDPLLIAKQYWNMYIERSEYQLQY